MPGFLTHYFFGKNTIKKLNDSPLNKSINENIRAFGLGLQGPDIFFYHIPAYTKKGGNIGNRMHDENVAEVFSEMLTLRQDYELFQKIPEKDLSLLDAYICGFIGHYTLDTHCHPYIFFATDYYENLKVSKTYDFGRHVSFETDIDHELLNIYEGKLPNQYKYADTIALNGHERKVIGRFMSEVLSKVFGEEVKSNFIAGAAKSQKVLNAMMHDPKGKKKAFVYSLELKKFGCCWISAMIPSDTIIKFEDSLNLNHKSWHSLWEEDHESNESMLDLIEKAEPVFLNRLDLYNKKDFQSLIIDLGNLSYSTGLPLGSVIK